MSTHTVSSTARLLAIGASTSMRNRLVGRRPPTLAAIAAVALAVTVDSRVAAQGAERDTRPTVAVMYFTNAALVRNDEYAPLSKGIAEMLITELAGNRSIRVVERDQLQKLL